MNFYYPHYQIYEFILSKILNIWIYITHIIKYMNSFYQHIKYIDLVKDIEHSDIY